MKGLYIETGDCWLVIGLGLVQQRPKRGFGVGHGMGHLLGFCWKGGCGNRTPEPVFFFLS
jgi:hypothetical protein